MKKNEPPSLGWTTQAEVTKIIDGDTIDVTITRHVRIRLLDCWAPETRTQNVQEKARGMDAKAALEELIRRHGPAGILHIPTGEGQQLADVITLGRVLGRVWLPGVGDVSEAMVAAGHATTSKDVK